MRAFFLVSLIKYYIIIGLLVLLTLILTVNGTDDYLSLLNFVIIISYGYILYYCSQRDDLYFTTSKLGFTVFLYSLIYVILYYCLSLYYNDDIMVFCYSDASAYKNAVEGMYNDDNNIIITRYLTRWSYDDWGAPFSMLFFYNIIPSKIFLNFVYIVLGTISSISLFSIGKNVMQTRHAYLAALSFGISSYWIWYHSSFLKETLMVFIVIESFFFFYRYVNKSTYPNLTIAILLSLLLIFFRPAVLAFLWASWSMYFMIIIRNRGIWLIYILIILVVSILIFSFAQQIFNRYTHSGDIESIKTYIGVTRFSWTVNAVAALIGPFPNLICGTTEIAYKHIYGPGLIFKYMLFVPFWYGAYYAIKHRIKAILPLFMFCIIEIIMIVVINNGLVLRKTMPHVPIFILCAIWFISVCDDEKELVNAKFVPILKFSWLIVAISTIIWNMFKSTY